MKDYLSPVFIVGVGRSGTSLLQGMLNAHSNIAFPSETHFIRNYLSKGTTIEDVRRRLVEDEYLKHLDLDVEKYIEEALDLHELYCSLMQAYARKRGKEIVGDKDPKNIEYLKTIKTNFPYSVIIHIYRDPRAVVASRSKAQWSEHKPLWQHILAYKAQYSYLKRCASLLGDRLIEIRYENLLISPRVELEKFLHKIGLDYEDRMLSYYRNAHELVKGAETAWKENVFKPIQKQNAEKWRNDLSKRTIKRIEKALYPEMRELGYEPDSISPLASFCYASLSRLYCMLWCK